jgi:hypothetical protein
MNKNKALCSFCGKPLDVNVFQWDNKTICLSCLRDKQIEVTRRNCPHQPDCLLCEEMKNYARGM